MVHPRVSVRRHETATSTGTSIPAGSMRLLVLAAALPRIVAFATLPDERMSYSSTGCPPGLLACEEGITFATSEDMLRNVHNAADHPEIDASLQLAKRCVPFGMYAKCGGVLVSDFPVASIYPLLQHQYYR